MDEAYEEVEILQAANAIEDVGKQLNLPTEWTVSVQDTTKETEKPAEDMTLYIFHKRARDLDQRQKNRFFAILEENVKEYYVKSSWGWHEADKRKELFHPLSRYIIVSKSSNFEELVENIVGYASYRFDWDDEEEPEHPVLYLYELQIVEGQRNLGIGKHIMSLLKTIAVQTNMWKLLLTCFKHNTKAIKFYEKVGFGIDNISPSRCGYHDESYEIMSDKPDLK